jgi:hypothetical protein
MNDTCRFAGEQRPGVERGEIGRLRAGQVLVFTGLAFAACLTVFGTLAGNAKVQIISPGPPTTQTIMGVLPVGTVLLFDKPLEQKFDGWQSCGSIRFQKNDGKVSPSRDHDFACLHKVQQGGS